jgi:L-lactate dehydrogenase complex protein LldF
MGSVLTPVMVSLEDARDLPNACTLNGRCREVCPVNIPLPDMLRSLRVRQFERRVTPSGTRWALTAWGWMAQRPALYRLAANSGVLAMRLWARGRGRIESLPLAGGWTRYRDLPEPEKGTFMQQYARRTSK